MNNKKLTVREFAERAIAGRKREYDESRQIAEPQMVQLESKLSSLKSEVARKEDKLSKIQHLVRDFNMVIDRPEGIHIYPVMGYCEAYEWHMRDSKTNWRSWKQVGKEDSFWGRYVQEGFQPVDEKDPVRQVLMTLINFSGWSFDPTQPSELERLMCDLYKRKMNEQTYNSILQKNHPVVITSIKDGEKKRGISFNKYCREETN